MRFLTYCLKPADSFAGQVIRHPSACANGVSAWMRTAVAQSYFRQRSSVEWPPQR